MFDRLPKKLIRQNKKSGLGRVAFSWNMQLLRSLCYQVQKLMILL